MARDEEKRKKLLNFLDEKAFDPVLNTSGDKYSSQEQKNKLKDVKQSTRSEKERYHNDYHSATDVKQNYLSDLDSDEADKIDAELNDLGLPSLPQFKDDFLKLCRDLHV